MGGKERRERGLRKTAKEREEREGDMMGPCEGKVGGGRGKRMALFL